MDKKLKGRNYLRIGKMFISNQVNGPGKRLVIWFQGCPIRCKGCINPEFWDTENGIIMSIEDIILIIKQHNDIEGVTFSGGEPLFQAEAILPLAEAIKSMNLSLFCFTGYYYEDIIADKIAFGKEILKYIDVLIDGPFIEKEKANLIWRGSKNQKVHFLTKKYLYLKPSIENENTQAELQIFNGSLVLTGFFELDFWKKLKHNLKT